MAKKIKLGSTVKDTITGFTGIATAEYNYLNGCKRYYIQPTELKDGKTIEGESFDVEQLEVVKKSKKKPAKPAGGPQLEPAPRPVG